MVARLTLFFVLSIQLALKITFASGPIPDTLDSSKGIHQVIAGFSFSNYPQYHQSHFAGITHGYAAHLMYSFNSSLWVEAKLYHLPGTNPFVSLGELAAGYTQVFNEVFDAGIIISRLNNRQYPPDPAFDHYTMINTHFGVDFGYVYTSVFPSWIWHDIGSFFMIINNSRFFVSPEFGRSGSFFTANPGVYFLLGRETWFRELPLLFQQRLRNRGLEHLIPVLSVVEKPFRFQTLTFTLPLSWERMPFSIELEPSFVFNLNTQAIVRQPEGFFIRAGLFINLF